MLVFAIAIIVGLFSFLLVTKTNNEGKDITEQCVRHGPKSVHIHPLIEIKINGKSLVIPKNIGIPSSFCMRPLHTHDESGIVDDSAVIHVESQEVRDFIIGDFFKIWDKRFNSTCIFDYCTDKGSLIMYVYGKEIAKFENYIMQDKDDILIEYITNES